ncbi:MAG: hypothetical protein OER56_01285 [Hyphomicrobiales bacterium]|nr:hypothetical protein [Hyphomicrobiales bacterium]
MLEFIYLSGWGAFALLLSFQLPFMFFFLHLIYKKTYVDSAPSDTSDEKITKFKNIWMTVVVVLFVAVNLMSIQYMPAVSSARAVASGQDVMEVDVTAASWSYEMSTREFVAGKPIRFTAKSTDTVHGFAIYSPDGDVLFTMMLVPGVTASSLIYTFKEPGTYKIRCLEYCGAAHHEMSDEIIVKASTS